MWKWFFLFLIIVLILVRFLSHTESDVQRNHTLQMDKVCKASRIPIHVILQGDSDSVASTLFEIIQKAECPRKIHVTIQESVSKTESAAHQQARAVRVRGLQDSPFDEHITWKDTSSMESISDEIGSHLHTIMEPLVCIIEADLIWSWSTHWDTIATDQQSRMDDSTCLTWTPPAFSRWTPNSKRLDIDWLPLHRNQKNQIVPVMFPSITLFGTKTLLQSIWNRWQSEFDKLDFSSWPWVAVHLGFKYRGLQIQQTSNEWIPLAQELKRQKKKFRWHSDNLSLKQRFENLDVSLSESLSLGLVREQSHPIEIILKYGSINEFYKNVHNTNA